MDQGFKEYLLDQARNWSDEDKKTALKKLKDDSDELFESIFIHMDQLGGYYAVKTKRELLINKGDERELVAAYRELFKDELAVMD